jgi:hypothetical protein
MCKWSEILFSSYGLSDDGLYGLEVGTIVDATRKNEENNPLRAVSNLSQGVRLEGALVAAHAWDVGKVLKCSVE